VTNKALLVLPDDLPPYRHLNNVMAQYDADGKTSTVFKRFEVHRRPVTARVFRDVIEGFVAGLDQSRALSGFDLATTVFNFMLPRGTVVVDRRSTGHAERREPRGRRRARRRSGRLEARARRLSGARPREARREDRHSAVCRRRLCRGHQRHRRARQAVEEHLRALYHELCEARTDPDVGETIRTGNDRLLGWYSARSATSRSTRHRRSKTPSRKFH
jgi:hypothetical protein